MSDYEKLKNSLDKLGQFLYGASLATSDENAKAVILTAFEIVNEISCDCESELDDEYCEVSGAKLRHISKHHNLCSARYNEDAECD